jgi:hypothetical protein
MRFPGQYFLLNSKVGDTADGRTVCFRGDGKSGRRSQERSGLLRSRQVAELTAYPRSLGALDVQMIGKPLVDVDNPCRRVSDHAACQPARWL